MRYRITWCIFAPLLLVSYGWLCWNLVSPLLTEVDSVLYESIGYMDAIIFGGFFSLIAIFSYRGYEIFSLNSLKPPHKLIILLFILGGIVGLSVNHLNYHFVIKKNEFIQCPIKSGYKNNLMDKYVQELKYCTN